MSNILPKILTGLVLVLLALNLYNSKTIELRDQQLATLITQQKETQRKTDVLITGLNRVEGNIKTAEEAWRRLQTEISVIDKKTSDYHNKKKDVTNATKEFLDTPLPADLRSLLDGATGNGD